MIKTILSLLLTVVSFGLLNAQITTYPYNEDFEGEIQGGTSCTSVYTMQAAGWTNLTTDTKDWSANAGTTGSTGTGPSVDHAPGTSTGFYLYTEATSCFGETAQLTSPSFDLAPANLAPDNSAEMSFWYHMYGADMGTLTVEITDDGGTTWTALTTLTDNQDLWQEAVFDLTPYVGSVVQFRFTGLTGSQYQSDMAIDDFSVVSKLVANDDAGAAQVVAPTSPVATGVQFVTATITNYGANAITSADVNWSVNGTVQTPTTFSGTLNPGDTSTAIVLGAHDFQVGSTDICVWTSNPNATTDGNPLNDTTCVSLCTGLNGTYALGGATPDYNTFNDAVNSLINCGVSGPVVFDVAAGTYTENIIIPPIVGASSTNTITFQGASASTTTITHDGTNNATVYLQGGDFIKFSDLTIETTGTVDSWCVFLSDTAEYDTVQNCNLTMPVGTYSDVAGIVASGNIGDDLTEGNNANYCVFDNNIITGGERAIALEGLTTYADWMSGIEITNNEMYNMQDYAVYADNQDSLVYVGNIIDSIQNSFGEGFYLLDISNFTIEENIVNAPSNALYISDGNYNLDGTPSGMARVVNNMFTSTDESAIYFSDVEMVNIWHNSLYSSDATEPAFEVIDLLDSDVQNNIFFSEASYAFESDDDLVTGNNVFDYNSYFTVNGTNLIRENFNDYVDLPAWQTAQPSQNVNSVELDPVFMGAPDLHVQSPTFDDLGSTVGVTVDVDGDSRPAGVNVDIGADEYTPVQDDAVLVDFYQPNGLSCGSNSTDVEVIISNYGANNITSLPIEVQITGDITQTLNTTYTGNLAFNEMDTVTVGTIDTYVGGSITMTGYTQLSGDQNTANDTITGATADFIPVEPAGGSEPSCGFDYTTLYADSSYATLYEWYDAATGGNLVGTGNTYNLPSISTQDTYYLQYSQVPGDTVSTTLTGTNGCGAGNMFDLTSTNGTVLSGVQVNSNSAAGSQITVNVYYKTGTYFGFETDPGAWTMEGSYQVTSNGPGAASQTVNLQSGVTLPAGQVIGVYVEFDADYTTGANTYVSNSGDVTVDCGAGLCSSFGGINADRTFNGNLFFGQSVCSAIRTPIQALQTPAADVNLGPDSTACEQNGNVILDPGTNLSNYMWVPSGSTDSTLTVTSNGQYSVTATDTDGCTNSDTIVVFFVDCLGIDEYNGISGLNIFPNPTKGQFEVQAQLEAGVTFEAIEIRSLDGKLISSSQGSINSGLVTKSFDLSKQESGVYFVRILTSEGMTVEKITIE